MKKYYLIFLALTLILSSSCEEESVYERGNSIVLFNFSSKTIIKIKIFDTSYSYPSYYVQVEEKGNCDFTFNVKLEPHDFIEMSTGYRYKVYGFYLEVKTEDEEYYFSDNLHNEIIFFSSEYELY